MSKLDASPLPHKVRYEREVVDLPPDEGWRERVPTPNARASCTCGQLDTGMVKAETAYEAVREHVNLYLPGAWTDMAAAARELAGPVRPDEEQP
ncbi:hypothetical protein SUDANB1_00458 [Streptomyces sp. enrichment culture]|uniref:hypothetical protein n=1 Tax=Streptomyces sp. enrichment culture TaxID=1795815 RepID=UPI003F55BA00